MERGPMALFGAIIAVGLGPALWLGAQLGAVNLAPNERPSTVGEQFPDNDTGVELDFGGTGAGQAPERAEPVTQYDLSPTASRLARPDAGLVGSRTSAKPRSSASASASVDPSPSSSVTPSAEPSTTEPSTPPTESTETPEAPEPSEPSEPPAGGVGAGGQPAGPGPDRPAS